METTIDGITVALNGNTLKIDDHEIDVTELRGKMKMATYTAIKAKIGQANWMINPDVVITWVRENLK